jgi:hypothetical protein
VIVGADDTWLAEGLELISSITTTISVGLSVVELYEYDGTDDRDVVVGADDTWLAEGLGLISSITTTISVGLSVVGLYECDGTDDRDGLSVGGLVGLAGAVEGPVGRLRRGFVGRI